jgi:hypothetical protein
MSRCRIDRPIYDLLVVLSTKLETLPVYEHRDGARTVDRELRERLQEDDRRHVDLLVDALRERLGADRPRDASKMRGEPLAHPERAIRSAPAGSDDYTTDWSADRR